MRLKFHLLMSTCTRQCKVWSKDAECMWPKDVECIWPKAECMWPKDAEVYVTELRAKASRE